MAEIAEMVTINGNLKKITQSFKRTNYSQDLHVHLKKIILKNVCYKCCDEETLILLYEEQIVHKWL
jgi:hypothetical protein